MNLIKTTAFMLTHNRPGRHGLRRPGPGPTAGGPGHARSRAHDGAAPADRHQRTGHRNPRGRHKRVAPSDAPAPTGADHKTAADPDDTTTTAGPNQTANRHQDTGAHQADGNIGADQHTASDGHVCSDAGTHSNRDSPNTHSGAANSGTRTDGCATHIDP